MYICGSRHDTVGIAPDRFEQRIPGEDPARIFREKLQDLRFFRGQVNLNYRDIRLRFPGPLSVYVCHATFDCKFGEYIPR